MLREKTQIKTKDRFELRSEQTGEHEFRRDIRDYAGHHDRRESSHREIEQDDFEREEDATDGRVEDRNCLGGGSSPSGRNSANLSRRDRGNPCPMR